MNYDEKLLCYECKTIFLEACDSIKALGYLEYSNYLYGAYMKIYKKMTGEENQNESKNNN